MAQILIKHGQFEVECRGPIEVRGKGLLTTYLVVTPYDNDQCDVDPMEAMNGLADIDMHCSGVASACGEAGENIDIAAFAAAAPPSPPPRTLDDDDSVEELGAGSGSLGSSD